MSGISRVVMAECPECDCKLRFQKPLKVGQLVVCPECEEALIVVSVAPLELDWADEDPWDYKESDDHHYRSQYS